jgi:hypothetical protein
MNKQIKDKENRKTEKQKRIWCFARPKARNPQIKQGPHCIARPFFFILFVFSIQALSDCKDKKGP